MIDLKVIDISDFELKSKELSMTFDDFSIDLFERWYEKDTEIVGHRLYIDVRNKNNQIFLRGVDNYLGDCTLFIDSDSDEYGANERFSVDVQTLCFNRLAGEYYPDYDLSKIMERAKKAVLRRMLLDGEFMCEITGQPFVTYLPPDYLPYLDNDEPDWVEDDDYIMDDDPAPSF